MFKSLLYICLPTVILLISVYQPALAQEDNTNPKDTTLLIEDTEKPIVTFEGNDTIELTETALPSPRKAALFSAALPGLGQVYNKKYWKVPIIYGGAAVLIYYIDFYDDNYNFFLQNLKAERAQDPDNPNITGFNERNLERRTDFFRRNRDFSIILAGVLYLLNIVDAHVDAHLQEFDIKDDISLQLKPSIDQTPFQTPVAGLALSLKLK